MLSPPNAAMQRKLIEMAQRASNSGRRAAILVGTAMLISTIPAAAQSPAAQRGLTFVRVHCAQCHAIDVVSESPLKVAPPFRDLHLKYPIETLRRPLSEGIIANHPSMPQFRLEADQINDVIAFMQSLER
jgi:cytochrome c